MKKNNIFRLAGFVMTALLAVVALFVFPIALGGATLAIVGAVVEGTPVSTVEVMAGSPTLDKDHISKTITKMRPASTPLDTILRTIGNQIPCKSFVTDYYAVDSRPIYDTVKTAYTLAGDGVASYDLVVNNIHMWTEDDLVMVKGISGSDSKDLVCFVVSRSVANETLLIQPLNGSAGAGTTAGKIIIPATIPVSTRLVRMGPAKSEKDAQTQPYGIVPVPSENYLQIFMTQVEETIYQKMYEKEVDWSFDDYRAQNIYNLRTTMELAFLFGYKMKFTDVTNAKTRYTTGGITRFVTKALEYGTGGADRTIDDSTFVDWTKSIFTGNCGADSRILFGGDGLMANLMKVGTVQKQIEAKNVEVKWGITFKQIETNFGMLLFKHHPLFDQAGWGDNGLVLDMNHIEKHTFIPMATRTLNLKESGQRNVDAVLIEECTGVVTRYPDTHAIISPKA